MHRHEILNPPQHNVISSTICPSWTPDLLRDSHGHSIIVIYEVSAAKSVWGGMKSRASGSYGGDVREKNTVDDYIERKTKVIETVVRKYPLGRTYEVFKNMKMLYGRVLLS